MSSVCSDNHPTNAGSMVLAINQTAEPMIPDEKLSLVKEMFAKNCTAEEFAKFVFMCNEYHLSPFLNQIYCVKYAQNSPAAIFVSSAGMLEIANRSGLLNGIESYVTMSDDGKKIISATAIVHKKGADYPFVKTVYFREYSQDNKVWRTKAITMLEKVAINQALRLAFSISGIYAEEERWDTSSGYRNQQVDADDIDVTPFVEDNVTEEPAIKKMLKKVENGGGNDISLF